MNSAFIFISLLLSTLSWTPGVDSSESHCTCKKNMVCDSAVAKLGVGVAAGIGAVAAVPAVLGAAGFTAGGVAAGSLAAAVQGAVYGGVTTGAFATLQSVGAAGLGWVSGGILQLSTSVGLNSAIENFCKCECE